MDTPEETKTEKNNDANKIDGVSSQINLKALSPIHKRFARLLVEAGRPSPPHFVNRLMEAYENPLQSGDMALEKKVNDLNADIERLEGEVAGKEREIKHLKDGLEEANRIANENAESGLGNQLKLEELQRSMAGAVVIRPNPVVAHFLHAMAKRTGMDPGKILEKLFIDDLQNPRANNLPYTVTSSEIRRVMEELKNTQQ